MRGPIEDPDGEDWLEIMKSREPTKVVFLAVPVSVYDYFEKLAEHDGVWGFETRVGHLVDQEISADLYEHGFGWSSWPEFPNAEPVAFEEVADARAETLTVRVVPGHGPILTDVLPDPLPAVRDFTVQNRPQP